MSAALASVALCGIASPASAYESGGSHTLATVSHAGTVASPPTSRAERRRAASVRRSMRRRLRPSSRSSPALAKVTVFDARATVTCRRELLADVLTLTINPGATFGARVGETVWYRQWAYDLSNGWLTPTRYNTTVAGSPYGLWPAATLPVTGSRSVAALLETWSASLGYQYDWYRPSTDHVSVRGYYCYF